MTPDATSLDMAPTARRVSPARAWTTIAILSVLYVLSFVDRLILALLVAPLKAEFGLTDVQLGLLFGPAFALFYAFMGLPIARLADRGNRKLLIFAGVALWSLATMGSAFAGAFVVLITLRIGLAIGEAALTPTTYSLIGDLFPPERRPLAASIYSACGMAGASAAFIIGAMVISGVETHLGDLGLQPWRAVLLAVGAPTLAVGLLFWFVTRDPPRGVRAEAAGMGDLLAHVRQHLPLYAGLFLGAGCTQAVSYAYSAWGPELLRRQYEWTVQQAGMAFGLAGLLAGSAGTLALPAIVMLLRRAGRADAIAITAMTATVGGATLFVMAPVQAHPGAFLALYGFGNFCLVGAANCVLVALTLIVPERMRATLTALNLTCITLVGLGAGPTLTAVISTNLDPSGAALGKALAILPVVVAGPALALFAWSRRDRSIRIGKAWA